MQCWFETEQCLFVFIPILKAFQPLKKNSIHPPHSISQPLAITTKENSLINCQAHSQSQPKLYLGNEMAVFSGNQTPTHKKGNFLSKHSYLVKEFTLLIRHQQMHLIQILSTKVISTPVQTFKNRLDIIFKLYFCKLLNCA